MAALCHFRTVFTDPGSIPKNSSTHEKDKSQFDVCTKCNCPKKPRTHHCSSCGRCIAKMDHHCSWINNCVGSNNQKHFILFLFYIEISCVYSMILLSIRAGYCIWNSDIDLCTGEKYETF